MEVENWRFRWVYVCVLSCTLGARVFNFLKIDTLNASFARCRERQIVLAADNVKYYVPETIGLVETTTDNFKQIKYGNIIFTKKKYGNIIISNYDLIVYIIICK